VPVERSEKCIRIGQIPTVNGANGAFLDEEWYFPGVVIA
jgi:hypothetical protein